MSPERNDLFLSQLREKRAESKRQKTLHQSNITAALTITTSSLSTQQVAASKPTNVPSTSTTTEDIVTCLSTFKLVANSKPTNLLATSTGGEHIVSCLSTFELGSTSTGCHVASKLPSTHTTNKGRNKLEVNLLNDNLVAKDYFLLKKVPNCKFCLAKRFQYESPCFVVIMDQLD
ncbi:hypothetical protein H5410_059352 [Solanum commersonii]|uniref:Uncharacterized protein n=1 Tax=Solanum commersonii TaxID=4109 RepID=A0A9J5W2A6_SOLCO|nr:hypothetical protein H5410_059352 [Solanum commersonii]